MLPQLDQDERLSTTRRARVAVLTALYELGGEARRQPLLAKALAEGDFSEGERAVGAPTDRRAHYESDVAFRLARALLRLQREGLVESPGWNVWRLTDADDLRPAPPAANPIDPHRAAELSRLPYHEYRRTPEWHDIRAAALARAGRRCALDRTHTEHLEVHHNSLERLGAELSIDLIVLCRSCHQAHHPVSAPKLTTRSPADAAAHRAAASIPPPASVTATAGPPAAVPAPTAARSRLRRFLRGV